MTELIQKLEIFFKDNPDMKGVPVCLNEISEIERLLNLKLNQQYVTFISKFGGSYAGLAIHGLKNAEMLGNESVIDLTLRARIFLKKLNINNEVVNSLVISDDGAGNPIYLNQVGELKVFYIDKNESDFLSKSLFDYISDNFQPW